jgi:hypothetical protein
MSVEIPSDKDYNSYNRDYLDLNVKNVKYESLFTLKFAYGRNGSILARGQELFNRDKTCARVSCRSPDFKNEDNTCELSVIVEPV